MLFSFYISRACLFFLKKQERKGDMKHLISQQDRLVVLKSSNYGECQDSHFNILSLRAENISNDRNHYASEMNLSHLIWKYAFSNYKYRKIGWNLRNSLFLREGWKWQAGIKEAGIKSRKYQFHGNVDFILKLNK